MGYAHPARRLFAALTVAWLPAAIPCGAQLSTRAAATPPEVRPSRVAAPRGGLPLVSIGIGAAATRQDIGPVPGYTLDPDPVTTIAAPQGTLWVDFNLSPRVILEVPLAAGYSATSPGLGGAPSATRVSLGVQPVLMLSRDWRRARPWVSVGGQLLWRRRGRGPDPGFGVSAEPPRSNHQLGVQGAVGYDVPVADARIRASLFASRLFEKDDATAGAPSITTLGLGLGIISGLTPRTQERRDSPVTIRAGAAFDLRTYSADGSLLRLGPGTRRSLAIPSPYVGVYVPLAAGALGLGADLLASHFSGNGESGTTLELLPALEVGLFRGRRAGPGVRLRAVADVRRSTHAFQLSARDIETTTTGSGFGGGAAFTFPAGGRTLSVGADYLVIGNDRTRAKGFDGIVVGAPKSTVLRAAVSYAVLGR